MPISRVKPRLTATDEAELRAFYVGCGFTADTIERAIRSRRGLPVEKGTAKTKYGRWGRPSQRATH